MNKMNKQTLNDEISAMNAFSTTSPFKENSMKTVRLSRTIALALAASSLTLWANGPMPATNGGSSRTPGSSSAGSACQPTRTTQTRTTQQVRTPPQNPTRGTGITVCYDYVY